MNEEEDIASIELYLQKKLSEEDRANLETRLRTDAAFAELFHDIRILIEGVKESSRQELRNDLKKVEEALSSSERKEGALMMLDTRWWIAIAASLTLAIILFTVVQVRHSPPELYTEFYRPYPNVASPTIRGEAQGNLAHAFGSYERGQYEDAAVKFESLEPKDHVVYFYLASAYLADEEVDKAIGNFEKCLALEGLFTVQARWYLALCYLYKEDTTISLKLLNEILKSENDYSDKAAQLIQRITAEK